MEKKKSMETPSPASDKKKALDTAIAQIEKNFGKGAVMRLGDKPEMQVDAIPTGSLALDAALGIGGVPKGRIIEIYGPESSGKTTLALHIVASAQKMGGEAAFVDAEHALDPVYAAAIGVDIDNMLVSQPDTGEQALEITDALVRSGAVDAEAAKPMTEKIEAYRAMTAAMNTVDSSAMDVDMDMRMDMTVTAEGETMQVPSTMQGNMKLIVSEDNSIQMAYTMETTSEGTSVDMDVWMKDGWVYLSTEAEGTAMKLKYSVEDQLAAVESLGAVNTDAMSVSGLAMLESVTAKTSCGNTEYTIVIGEGVNGLLENVLDMMGQDAGSMDMRLGKMTATYTVDSKGNMKKVDMTFTASVKMDVPMEDGQSYSMAADYDYDMSMTVNATGKDVKVTFPDFSDFQEIDPSQMAA